ncbi:hypothetical protein CRUP_003668 [Coryphaenoides rupestris]|nr:hypothetical protein CRUP_003668 [Coryphaenoides rupestris]
MLSLYLSWFLLEDSFHLQHTFLVTHLETEHSTYSSRAFHVVTDESSAGRGLIRHSPKDFTLTAVSANRSAVNLSTMNRAMVGVYCAVALVGIVGNGLVIYVTAFRMKRTVNSIWFLNLAVADFLFTSFLILIIVSLSQGYHWPFGEIMCKLRAILTGSNIYFLTAISVDRCLCTWVVVWSQNHRTVRSASSLPDVITGSLTPAGESREDIDYRRQRGQETERTGDREDRRQWGQ